MNFNLYIQKILKECDTVASTFGNDGTYDTSDVRTPKIMGPMLRRNKKRTRKKSK